MDESKVFKHLVLFLALMCDRVIETCVGDIIKITRCTCPGDTLVYQCEVTGSGYTIWRGTAFECSTRGNQIIMRHTSFGSDGFMGSCGEAIVGHSIAENNTIFTSQLMVNLSAQTSNLVGRTVECVYQNSAHSVNTIVGSATIQLTAPPAPPVTVQLARASPNELLFNWSSVDSNCSSLQYKIISDCGACSSHPQTLQTNVTCNIALSTGSSCSLAIQSVVCDNVGNKSALVDVMLKVPQQPEFTVIPHYNANSNNLIALDINITKVESFNISAGVDGSASNYTISYTDSHTNALCDSLTIPSTSCIGRYCIPPHIEPLPCSQTIGKFNGTIDIAISATNMLGRGPPTIISIGAVNRYVNVTFESMNKIVCEFLGQHSNSELKCDIAYHQCQQNISKTFQGIVNSTSTVIIDVPENHSASELCYTITARNDSFTVVVQGDIAGIRGPPTSTNPGMTSTTVVALGVTVGILLLILMACIVI